MSKKVVIPTKPVRDPAKLDQWISGAGESPPAPVPQPAPAVAVVVPPPAVPLALQAPVAQVLAAPVSAPSEVTEPEPPTAPAELMKRLTIDITDNLHRRIKATCANRGTKMVDEIRIILESAFP